MRKCLLFCVCVVICYYSVLAERPGKGSFGATAGFNLLEGPTADASTTGTLLFKYYVTDDLALRVAVNYLSVPNAGVKVTDSTRIPAQSVIPSGDGYTKHTRTISGGNFNFELGAQYNIASFDKTEIYAGGVLLFGTEGSRRVHENTLWLKDQTDIGRYKDDFDDIITNTAFKTRYGAKIVLGANYFVTPNLSLGAEFGYGFASSVEQGGAIEKTSMINGDETKEKFEATNFYEVRGGFYNSAAVLTLSIFF